MNFNNLFDDHPELRGRHAFLSPSQYHWVNYTPEKLEERFYTSQAAAHGTELHDLAARCIKLKRKQPRNKDTFNMYVNDAIGLQMRPEQPLRYSNLCFGTADAISFTPELLRIHDLKTGTTPASMTQLEIYAAIFFLEYGDRWDTSPEQTDMELRIYQLNEKQIYKPEPEDIRTLMDQIVEFNAILESLDQYR